MTGRPVNIAEFRCRAMRARTVEFSARFAARSTALKIVEPSSVVFDIGMARDGQRFRRRPAAWPISIHSRGQVIRFGEGRRLALAAMRAPAPSVAHSNPFDLPPAA